MNITLNSDINGVKQILTRLLRLLNVTFLVPHEVKKHGIKLLCMSSPDTDFQNSFIDRLGRKFATKRSLSCEDMDKSLMSRFLAHCVYLETSQM